MTGSRHPTARILPANAKRKGVFLQQLILLQCENDLALSSNAVLRGNVFISIARSVTDLPTDASFLSTKIPVIEGNVKIYYVLKWRLTVVY
jgi:hypothetical protein